MSDGLTYKAARIVTEYRLAVAELPQLNNSGSMIEFVGISIGKITGVFSEKLQAIENSKPGFDLSDLLDMAQELHNRARQPARYAVFLNLVLRFRWC